MSLRLWQIVPDLATVDALAEPWQKLYAHSTVVATLVLFGHVGGLIVAGALTFSMESGALRLDPADEGDGQRLPALPRRPRGLRGVARVLDEDVLRRAAARERLHRFTSRCTPATHG